MSKIAKDKVRVHMVMSRSLIARVDSEAERTGLTRTGLVTRALRSYLNDGLEPSTRAQVDELKTALTLMASEVAHLRTLTDQVLQESRALPTPIVEQEPAPRKLSITERLTGRLKK